jgi:hypothetical protein
LGVLRVVDWRWWDDGMALGNGVLVDLNLIRGGGGAGRGEVTYDDRAPYENAGGVCRRPMAETELRRFFSAAKADDCGRSMRRPYRHLYR